MIETLYTLSNFWSKLKFRSTKISAFDQTILILKGGNTHSRRIFEQQSGGAAYIFKIYSWIKVDF